jgi:glycosyltransferase involved in cell wall biosynthesis
MNNTLRIGMLIGRFSPVEGGAEIQCRRLSRELLKKNQSVFVLTQSLPRVPCFEVIDGLPVYRIGLAWKGKLGSLSYFLHGLVWLLGNNSAFDILHVHMASSPAILAAIVGKLCRKPVILKFAGSRATGDVQTASVTWYGRLKLRLLKELIGHYVCPSGEIAQELRDRGFNASRITIIPNGVDTQQFSPVANDVKLRLRSELSLPADAFVAVYCGRLQAGKGLDVLITTWDEIARRQEARKMLLLVVGSGTLQERLEGDYGRWESIRFAGWKSETERYLRAADLFILPSYGEGMSNALIEAMSCGLPCIATRIGGIEELIQHKENGYLFEPGDNQMLGRHILTVLTDGAGVVAAGRKARDHVLACLSIAQVADQYTVLYKGLLPSSEENDTGEVI